MAYTIAGRKCGTVRFTPDGNGNVQTEQVSMTSKVTSNPVESGSDINDHVIKDPIRFTISGTIIGGQQAVSTLTAMRDKRDIITYTGRSRIASVVITSLSFDYGAKNKGGCTFKATFQQVIITGAEVVAVGAVPLMSSQDAGKSGTSQANRTGNAGTQTTLTQNISGSAYAAYVNSYGGGSSAGPTTRATASYNGVS